MSQVAIWAKIPVKPGTREQAVAAMQAEIAHVTENEPGAVYYILHHDPKDEEAIYFYELYADQDAVQTHGASETMKAMGPALAPFMAGRLELKFLTPVQGKGL